MGEKRKLKHAFEFREDHERDMKHGGSLESTKDALELLEA